MSLVVQKYGGSSLGDAESIKRVAHRIVETKKAGHQVCVVVSAMGDTTDELLDLAEKVSPVPPPREMDMLLTAGERMSMALVAMAIADLGHSVRSFTGSQAGVITDTSHGKAKIIDVTPGRITEALGKKHIVIVAGFQGVSQGTKEITTLGRGGSDTTAVALAAALEADVCEIYTDVDGIFTADPRIVPQAHKIDRISHDEMLEMAASGAKILHLRCVEYARRSEMPIHVRSSFSSKEGTWVLPPDPEGAEDMEDPIIAGVAHDSSEAKITVVGVPDQPGRAGQIFTTVAEAQVNIDMIVQNVSEADTGRTDISFTLPMADGQMAVEALMRTKDEVGFESIRYDDQIGKLSLVGAGMRTNPGVSATFFKALADAGINIEMISTSEIRISVVTRADQLDEALQPDLLVGVDDEDEVVLPRHRLLDEQGHVMDTDRRAGLLGLREVLRRPAPDRRMGDALERGERRRVAEDDPAQGGAVQGPVGPEDPLPEALPDLLECRLPRLDDLTGDLVGVDDDRPELGEPGRHRRLPRPDPACQSDAQHEPDPRPGRRPARRPPSVASVRGHTDLGQPPARPALRPRRGCLRRDRDGHRHPARGAGARPRGRR